MGPEIQEYSVLQIVGVGGIGINSGGGRGQPGQVLRSLCVRLKSLHSFYICKQTLKAFGQINYLRFQGLELYKEWNKGGEDWNYTSEKATEKRTKVWMKVATVAEEMERSGKAGPAGKVAA